jgi:hypothetical protein
VRALVAAAGLFLLAFAAQAVIWRCRRPRAQYTGLLGLYLGALALVTVGLVGARLASAGAARLLPVAPLDYLTFALLYVGLVLAFGTTYSAVQADSPTMSVLLAIEATSGRGLALAELLDRFPDRVLVVPRLDDLVAGGLARLRDGRYVIAPRGVLFARPFVLFRRLLGFGRGG